MGEHKTKVRNDGKHFEKKSHEVISKLNPTQQVLSNVRITGKLSETSRQLDVIMKEPTAYDFIAFECKDEAEVIGTPTVEGYATKLNDVGAKHGAIVSNTGYSRGAKNMATKLGIDLLNLVDTTDDKIKTKLTATTLLIREQVKDWQVEFAGSLPNQARHLMDNLGAQTIRRPGKKNSIVLEIANDLWNELADGEAKERPGTYTRDEEDCSISAGNGFVSLPPMRFTFKVNYEYRVGILDITQTQGLYNVKHGSFQTSHAAYGPFGEQIFATWTQISKEERDRLQPSVVLHTRTDLRSSKPGKTLRQ